MLKKLFGAILLVTMLSLPLTAYATKDDWYDRNYNFRSIRNILVFDATVTLGMDYGGQAGLNSLQDTFRQNARKLHCNVITEAQARQMLSYQLGVDLNALNYSNPMQARLIISQNAARICDAWIIGNVDNIANNSYVKPGYTSWETRREKRIVYDAWGRRYEETYDIQVPVTHPPQRVDTSGIQMTIQVFDSRSGAQIFTRRDMRDRNDYQAQGGMYGRICNSFFEDFDKKLR